MLDESNCHFRGVGLFCYVYSIFHKILLANTVDPDQTPYYVASDLGLLCLPVNPLRVPIKNWLISIYSLFTVRVGCKLFLS